MTDDPRPIPAGPSPSGGAPPGDGPAGEHRPVDACRQAPAARLLRHVLEVELESALQKVFTVRQDLSELSGTSADRRVVASSTATLEEVVAGVRVLLAVLRAFGPSVPGESGLHDPTTSAFAVVRPDGEVLYMNAAVTRIVQRDHRSVAATPFEDRTWTDREQMRRHLDLACRAGSADDVFEVVRGDGHTIEMRLHTERLDADGDVVLLMTYVPG